mmetsp:Transcript_15913/g.40769  ORF Transcript_15913/g.40769 Transcript_15913/m.40769 type:complete len:203 (+) Transcript_15913:5627-6235(+)
MTISPANVSPAWITAPATTTIRARSIPAFRLASAHGRIRDARASVSVPASSAFRTRRLVPTRTTTLCATSPSTATSRATTRTSAPGMTSACWATAAARTTWTSSVMTAIRAPPTGASCPRPPTRRPATATRICFPAHQSRERPASGHRSATTVSVSASRNATLTRTVCRRCRAARRSAWRTRASTILSRPATMATSALWTSA